MKYVVAALMLFSASAWADLEVGVMTDVLHARGATILHLRNGNTCGLTSAVWLADGPKEQGDANLSAGFDCRYIVGKWRPFLGLTYIDQTNEVNGTRWNFQLGTCREVAKNLDACLYHYSHGRFIGIEDGKPNDGWNFVGVSYRLPRL